VIVTVPAETFGTSNPQLNEPEELVDSDPLVQLEIAIPSKSTPTTLDKENPFPDKITDAPIGPLVGFTVILGVVTVKLVVAFWAAASVAETVDVVVPLGT
jgi:hypothetical protein